jgi:hypothetical protein
MEVNAQEARQLLESVAISHAADKSQQGLQHASRLARLQVGSWQADVIRNSPEIRSANNPPELRALMADRDVAIVFVPQSAMVTAEIIERTCAESSFNKLIIWEDNG